MNLDVFRQRPFNVVEMLDHVRQMPYVPTQLRDLGIFTPRPIRSRTFYVSGKKDKLTLIPVSTIGAPPETYENDLRDAIPFNTTRLAKRDRIVAEELQGVLADASETQLKNVAGEVNERLVRMRMDMELTKEHMRLGAINGQLIDADGSTVIADFFQKFAVTKPTAIDFDLDNATLSTIAVACDAVRGHMEVEGGAAVTLGTASVVGLAGRTFWRKLMTHPEVINVYTQGANIAAALDRSPDTIELNGIRFVRYRGTDDAAVGVADAECRFVVAGGDMFREVYSPAEFGPFINTLGQPEYPMVLPDTKREAFVDVELYSYPFMICERPRMLISGTA